MISLTRRRFLTIAASASGVAFAGSFLPGRSSNPRTLWTGTALGAPAGIVIDAETTDDAQRITASCLAELNRLENLFSLYRSDSQIRRLNGSGLLDNPDPDFLQLLSVADRVNDATGGRFDPTIQSRWAELAEFHTVAPQSSRSLPQTVPDHGWADVRFDSIRVEFGRPGMALTLNGIAQGFITDKITGLLRASGLKNLLVNMGEIRTIGPTADGAPWRVEVPALDRAVATRQLVSLHDQALATSHTTGTTFDEAERFGHIIDPATGLSAPPRHPVSVVAPSAAIADGLSTAFCLMNAEERGDVLSAFDGARLTGNTG